MLFRSPTSSLFRVIENQINKNEEEDKNKDNKEVSTMNLLIAKPKVATFVTRKAENSKYAEIDTLQRKLDNIYSKLLYLKQKSNEIEGTVQSYVLDEINTELSMYISKVDNLK